MTDSSPAICFTCEQTVESPPRFRLLPSGELCPTCRDRVLEAAPPLLPGAARERAAARADEDPEAGEEDGEGSEEALGFLGHGGPLDDPDPPLSA